jgi:hypothetical protein
MTSAAPAGIRMRRPTIPGAFPPMSITPLHAPLCPICGKPNACAASEAGSFEVDCWCRDVDFSEALIARVPAGLRGRACICRACATDEPSAPRDRTDGDPSARGR